MIAKVLQINIRPLSDEINKLGCWKKACDAYPEVDAYQRLSAFGSKAFEPEMLERFDLVHVLEVPGLEEAFAVLNGMPVDGAWFIHQGRGHSLSVGDIVVECTPTEQIYHMVDMIGFKEVMRQPAP